VDFDIPKDIQDYLAELDQFIEDVILPLQMKDDNNRFFDHRREDARTDWERGGLPNEEWEQLLGEMRRLADEAGHYRFAWSKEHGGKEGSNLAMAIIREHLARKGLGLHNDLQNESSIVGNNVGVLLMEHHGTPEQKAEWMPHMLAGTRGFAFGITEPNHGSDATHMETTAYRDGDEWVINGGKRFITNAGVAGTYIVTAVTDREEESGKISAFIVEADAPGFSIGRMEEKMGLHASNTGELIFDDCRVPAGNLLGAEGEGDRLFLKTLDGGRIGIASMALGLAQAAYEAASAYSKERRQFGRAIGEFQGVAFKIADMATSIDAARLLTYRAAWLKDCGRPYSTEAAMAKLFASEVARDVTNDAVQVHGGYGYITEYKVERYLRDAKLTEIGEGTSEIQRMVIARNLLGLRAM
jgi:alkylation response protein AidB-like acyl-CoA dehydrogenase